MELSTKKIVSLFLFAAICLVFALFGLPQGNLGNESGSYVGVVNNTVISRSEFQQELQRMEQMYGQFFGGQFGAQQNFLKSQVFDQLVNRELIAQGTEKQGIISSNGEIKDFIVGHPAFQEKGRFQRDRYDMFLNNSGKSAGEFEGQLKKELRVQRLVSLIELASSPTATELKKEQDIKSTKMNLSFVRVSSLDLEGKQPVGDVNKWAGEHSKEVADYYQQNSTKFNTDEQVRVRHILIKAPKGDKKAEDAALAKIKNIAAELKDKKADFGDLAAKYSEDSTKSKKGDLGFFGHGAMVPEFDKAAFSMEIGKVSEPVKTEFGWHLLEVMEKKPKSLVSLEQATPEIAKTLIQKESAHKSIQEFKDAVASKNEKAISDWLAKNQLVWQDTGMFSLADPTIPKLGSFDEFSSVVTAISKDKPMAEHLVPSQGAEYLVKFKSLEITPEKKTETDDLQKSIARSRSQNILGNWIGELRKTASISKNQRLFTAE